MANLLLKGIAVAPGVARGKAFVLVAKHDRAVARRDIGEADIAGELARFETALAGAEAELLQLQRTVTIEIGADEGGIFGAQALLVRSDHLVDPVRLRVERERVNLEAALADVLDGLVRGLEAVTDPILRERAADVRDIGRRVLAQLATDDSDGQSAIPEGSVVVAEELLPSVSARLDLQRVAALVTERGGRSSHASILARARGLTAVAGIGGATTRIKTGDALIVDGIAGIVFIEPDAQVEREYLRIEADIRTRHDELQKIAGLPSVTADGEAIPLLANINAFSDTESAHRNHADGIGLYRTEFGYAIRAQLPSEDEQYEFLARAAARFHPRPVTFRLLDIGGDKELASLPLPPSRNPSLAQRGIRLLLDQPALLRAQLCAFLRVAAEHPVSILVPVVGGVEDLRRTRAALRDAEEELTRRGVPFGARTPLGAMIEVPSAALLTSTLAREVDFFSLGTNDLVQYVLAVDREDERVANAYQPLHPAVLRLIHAVATAARTASRPLSICGEMGGTAAYTALLIGLGVRRFSVAPGQMLEVKRAIRATRVDDAERLAQRALELSTVEEIEQLLGCAAAN